MGSDPHVADIANRLKKRGEPAIGTCQLCGHRQEMMPGYQPLSSPLADEQWKCRRCRGQIEVSYTLETGAPTTDDDLAYLLTKYFTAPASSSVSSPVTTEDDGHHTSVPNVGDSGQLPRVKTETPT